MEALDVSETQYRYTALVAKLDTFLLELGGDFLIRRTAITLVDLERGQEFESSSSVPTRSLSRYRLYANVLSRRLPLVSTRTPTLSRS